MHNKQTHFAIAPRALRMQRASKDSKPSWCSYVILELVLFCVLMLEPDSRVNRQGEKQGSVVQQIGVAQWKRGDVQKRK
jgi:hypothetical protein